MARYIDADKLMEAIEKDIEPYKSWDCAKADAIMDTILDAPTADVVEVKHGYWYEIDSDVGWELVGCSVCRKEYSLCDGEDRTDYCPDCGQALDWSDTE
jgi:hypothetical protein